MKNDRLLHAIRRSLIMLLAYTICCVAFFALFTVGTLHEIAVGHKAHALSFVPAKRLTTDFERDLLNARIFFIYYVTIQKPGSLESGWQRYHGAQSRMEEIAALVDEHPELANLRGPVAQLRQDVANYSVALADTLNMVSAGELKGPHYDAQVKQWASVGATMVKDAGDLEKLTFKSSEANTNETSESLQNGQTMALLLLIASVVLCLVLTVHLLRRITNLLLDKQPDSGVSTSDAIATAHA